MKSGGLFLAMNQSPPARAKQSLNSSVAAPSDFQGAEFPRNLNRHKLSRPPFEHFPFNAPNTRSPIIFFRSTPFTEKNAPRLLPSPVYASSRPAVPHPHTRQSNRKIPATHNVAFVARLNPAESALTQVLIPQDINLFSFRTYEKSGDARPDSVNQPASAPGCAATPRPIRRVRAAVGPGLASPHAHNAPCPRRHQPLNLSLFFLPVVRRSPMLPQKMLVMQMLRDRTRLRIRADRRRRHRRNFFHNHRRMCRLCRRCAPAKWRMPRHQNSRHVQRIQLRESPHDRVARIHFIVVANLFRRQRTGHRNRPVKIIRMRRAEARNLARRLRPRRCVSRMRVRHAADSLKRFVQNQMRRQVRRRPQTPFHRLAVQIDNNQIFRLHRFVRHAARLDRNQSFFAIDPARIPKRVQHQPAPHQFQIGFQYFFAQRFQNHAFPRALAAIRRSAGKTPPTKIAADSAFPNPKYSSRYSTYNSSYTFAAFASGSITRCFGQSAACASSIESNAFAAIAAKIAEPRLVTSDCGIKIGLFSTLAYTRFNTSFFCGMPPPLITRWIGTPCASIRSRIIRVWNAVPSIAAKSSSCAVVERFQPSVIPPSSGFTSTVRSPLSHVSRSRPLCPGMYASSPVESCATVLPARCAIALKISPVAESPASTPVFFGCTDPGTTPHTPGISCVESLIAMMHVEVPTTFTTSPVRAPAPIASQCASNAPTGIGIPAFSPSFSAHSAVSVPAIVSLAAYRPFNLSRTPPSSGSTLVKNFSDGNPPSAEFHIHLCPIAQIDRGAFAGSVIPQSTAATMSQCSSAVANFSRLSGLLRSQCSSLEKPHSDEYVPPHQSITSCLSRCAVSVISAASLADR